MIRAQNYIDKAKKRSEKTGCYLSIQKELLHKHRKENSFPGNNCRTGFGVCNILEGEYESILCCCKSTTFIKYSKSCTGMYELD